MWRVLTNKIPMLYLKCQIEKGKIMSEKINWDTVEDSIAERLGGNPSYRLVRRLTGYAYNILQAMRWPAVDSATYELVVYGVCNAAVTGKEEL